MTEPGALVEIDIERKWYGWYAHVRVTGAINHEWELRSFTFKRLISLLKMSKFTEFAAGELQ